MAWNWVNSTQAGSPIRSESPAIETAEPASSSKNTRAHGGTSGLPTETHEEGGQYILRYNKDPDTGIFYLVRHFLGMSFVLLIENLSYSSEGEKLTKIYAGVKDNTMKYLKDVYEQGVNDDGKIVVPVVTEGFSRPNTYEVVRIVHLAHRQENLFEKRDKKSRCFDMSQLYALLMMSAERRYCRSTVGTHCESFISGPESLLDSIAEGTIYLINYCLQTMPQDKKQKSNHDIRRPALCIKKLDNDEALFLPIATFGSQNLPEVFKGEFDYAKKYWIPIIHPGGGGGSGLSFAKHKPVNFYPLRKERGIERYTEGYVYALEVKAKVAKVRKVNGVPSKIHEDDLPRVQKIVSENIRDIYARHMYERLSGGGSGSGRQSGGGNGSGSPSGGGNGSPSGGGSGSPSGGGNGSPSGGGSASPSGGGSASPSGGGSGGGGGGDGNRGRSGHGSSGAGGNGSGSKRKRKSEYIDDHEATPEKLPAHDEGGSRQCGRNEAHLENTLGEKYSYPRVCELIEDLSEMDPWDGCGTWPLNVEQMMIESPVDEQQKLSVIGSRVDEQQKLTVIGSPLHSTQEQLHYNVNKRAIWPTVTNESIFRCNNEFDQLQETKDVGLMNLLLTINKLEEEGKSPTVYDVNIALMKQGKIPWALIEDSLVECIESVECMNEDVNHKFVNALKEVNWNNDHLYLESGQDDETDAELLLKICFMTRVKVTHLIINGPLEKGPKILKLFVNHPNMYLPCDTEVAVQTIELLPKHLQGEPVALDLRKFNSVDSLQVLAQGQKGVPGETLQIMKFALIGSTIETTDVSRIEPQCSMAYAMTQFGDSIW